MKNYKKFLSKKNTASEFNKRLRIFIEEYLYYKQLNNKPISILDIGCGKNCELFKYKEKEDKYYGCDFYKRINVKIDNYLSIDLNEKKLSDKYKNQKFDIIFCGEVIEHLFNPDELLDEIKELMHSESILILSTPNLGYYPNRLLLLFGISPLFLENSSELKLGRRFKSLGQYHETEGHIRVFTYRAIKDLLKIKKFKIDKIRSVPVWDNPIDRFICLFSKSLAPNNVFVVKK
jgi:2-polyprenyl-3-methyl-5-hydroxy-6-metoxy-1,4-benzoquinol methylase